MQTYETQCQESSEAIEYVSAMSDIAVADTGKGYLVFEIGRESPEQTENERDTTFQLIGFANVSDRDIVADTAAMRGYRDTSRFPKFEMDEAVLQRFQAVNKTIQKRSSKND